MQFKLSSPFQPKGDQPQAIAELVSRIESQKQHSVLLGVTGSGKTYTMAQVIEKTQQPTLIIAHNKTLAAQLYQEFRDFFPDNAVSYFVSYYDYYQPEAYIPSTDTYIEKEATINDEIDKLRLATTTNLLTRKDVIVVASVSAIYNLGSPTEYGSKTLELLEGMIIQRETLLLQLSNLQYKRSDADLQRGTFRVRGDTIQVWPAYEDSALKLEFFGDELEKIIWIDPVSGTQTTPPSNPLDRLTGAVSDASQKRTITLYPAKHYIVASSDAQLEAIAQIRVDLQKRLAELRKEEKIVEAYRLEQKVNYDLEMIQEFGFVNGIENYSRYFDGRKPGDPPYTLLHYFHENAQRFNQGSFITMVDESHITLPQIKGMHRGDRARKETLIDYGFRLPSALDNRPLNFDEFLDSVNTTVCVSATPDNYEISLAGGSVVEQLIRPTGLVDPKIELRPTQHQIEDLVLEIMSRKQRGERVLVTTLTKKQAEALTEYLNTPQKIDLLLSNAKERSENQTEDTSLQRTEYIPDSALEIGTIDTQFHTKAEYSTPSPNKEYPKVAYLHSDIETLERSDILDDLRKGTYDVVVGINLLREGLDLPEVTLVAILDADKEGFLRSRTSLIQTIGRAARHSEGISILYADRMTKSIAAAIEETQRRRKKQTQYNKEHGITPQTISKPIRKRLLKKKSQSEVRKAEEKRASQDSLYISLSSKERIDLKAIDANSLPPDDRKKLARKLRRRMLEAAKDMDFELAALLRDHITELEK